MQSPDSTPIADLRARAVPVRTAPRSRGFVGATLWACMCLSASGCSAVISRYISSRPDPSFSSVASEQQLREQGFSKGKFCSAREPLCLSYFSAEPLMLAQKLQYEVEIDAVGRTERVRLQLDRQDVPAPIHGTVLLLHGFRASKEFMANTALYFRFLGFEVLMPDLLGHGESDGPPGFGIKDSQLLNELLDNRPHGRLYVLGNSMGAVAATHLAVARQDIAGLILQAPMPEFGLAAVRYIESYSPLLAACLSDRAIEEGARQAVRRSGVDVAQTDIKPLVATLSVPVLILASPDDPVAPPGDFGSLTDENVLIRTVEGRSHPGMAVIGSAEAAVIDDWLEASFRSGS